MNAPSQRPEENRNAEHLERTADRLREDLDRTLDALERRLAPGQLLDRSLNYLREHGGEMASAVSDSVRRNPVPILLTVAGLGWLIVSTVRGRELIDVTVGDDYPGDDARDDDVYAAADDNSALGDDSLQDSLYGESQTMRRKFRDRVAAARAGTRRAQYRVVTAIEEQPFLFGGLAVAIGALLGVVIPSTQYEDRVVGQVRDRAVERAKQMGERQYQNLRSQLDTHRDVEVSGRAH
jgi:ElaB/YqjD/DUF883 family membrane-anchored ribosome-binding protein